MGHVRKTDIGCEGIIRGSDGEWFSSFAKRIVHGNAYIAELWGVFEGLHMLK
ncbi:hypothetical protein A2U01_0094703, partial [Trifolium medium]|nr:hypothetical protein [Trifolium medium]